ncbi:MAG: tetratricopeptide repeat protein [Alphaproteobacteria bacterium]
MTHTNINRTFLMAGAGSLALLVGACSGSFLNVGDTKKAQVKKPRSAASLMRLGDSTMASGASEAAARFYDAASKAAPKDPVPRMRLARALQVMGAHRAAIGAYQTALALDPGITDAERGIANSLISLDQPRQAIKHYRTVIAKTGDHRAYNGLGVALDMIGKQKQARNAYRAGLKKRPGNLSLKNNLALSMALAGEYKAAASMLREVAKNPRASARHRQNLALVYGLSGEYKRAAKVARIDLDTPAIKRNLAYYEWLRKQPRSTVKRLLGRSGSAQPTAASRKKPAASRKKPLARPDRQPLTKAYRPISSRQIAPGMGIAPSLGIARSGPRIVQAVARFEDARPPVRFARLEVSRGSNVQSIRIGGDGPIAQPIVARPIVAQPIVAQPVAKPVAQQPRVAPMLPRLVVGTPGVKVDQVAALTPSAVVGATRRQGSQHGTAKVRAAKRAPKVKVIFARLGINYLMGKAK